MAVTWTPTANPAITDFTSGGSPNGSFASVATGPASTAKKIVIGFYVAVGIDSTNPPVVGGQTMTLAWTNTNGGANLQILSIYFYDDPGTLGATNTVAITGASNLNFVGIWVGYLLGAASGAPSSTADSGFFTGTGSGSPVTTTAPLTVPTNGMGIIQFGITNNYTDPAPWVTGTEDLFTQGATDIAGGIGHLATTGSPSITNIGFSTGQVGSAAWGPLGPPPGGPLGIQGLASSEW